MAFYGMGIANDSFLEGALFDRRILAAARALAMASIQPRLFTICDTKPGSISTELLHCYNKYQI